MIDIFLIKYGVIKNVIAVESLALAQQLFPFYTLVERTEANAHLNAGDTI